MVRICRSFSLIAGLTENFGIGFQNGLPWKSFPDDMKWFRKATAGSTVIMGRKTWESLGCHPLPKRDNRIISSQAAKLAAEYATNLAESGKKGGKVNFYFDLDSALDRETITSEKVFIIGGSKLYEAAMSHPGCQSLLITHAKIKLETDTKFPPINQSDFRLGKVLQSGSCPMTLLNEEEQEVKYEIVEYLPKRNRFSQMDNLKSKVTDIAIFYTPFTGEAGYLQALRDIMEHGEERQDRTGVGTKALFGLNFRYDLLNDGYPLLTTKKMFTRGIFEELLWFLRGSTDVKELREKNIRIWDGNSTREFLDSRGLTDLPEYDIGPAYGAQFRHAGAKYTTASADYTGQGVDQVAYVIDQLKNNPHSRRILINLWNVAELENMALPPCLFMYQFWVSEDKYLNLSLYQRSGDMGLGVPFNIASASLLMYIIGKLTGLIPKELVHTIGDAHIYLDHLEPMKRQVARKPRPFPKLRVVDREQKQVEDFLASDFVVEGYTPYPGIKMKMAV